MAQTISTAFEEEINAAFSLAEGSFEIEIGEMVEDHDDPPPFDETDKINEILASCDWIDEGM
jgi:hypothetical protein